MKVLIVEDDARVAELVKNELTSSSHVVEVALDGAEGSFLGRSYEYDAILLDYSLPKKTGLVVCKEIRSAGKQTPIIFLSVTDDECVKVAAFENGADDYVTKPFSLGELRARLKAVNRRSDDVRPSILQVHDLVMDVARCSVSRGTDTINLTRKEFSLLEYLMRNQGTVLSRAIIMEHVWTADNDPFSNTVEAHIRNLRMKLNIDEKQDLIRSVPGRGYTIDVPKQSSTKLNKI